MRDVIANRPAQHGIRVLNRVENGAQRDQALHVKGDFAVDTGQRPQVRRELHADHVSVCTSTDNTAGRSRTIGFQESPALADM